MQNLHQNYKYYAYEKNNDNGGFSDMLVNHRMGAGQHVGFWNIK